MKALDTILAKSPQFGGTTLLEHTRHVVEAAIFFAQSYQYDFDITLVKKAAAMHDLGKAHPHFQHKIYGKKAKTLVEQEAEEYIHRHELSSLGFLPVFPKEEWGSLIDMVVAHHKSAEADKRKRGIIDLEEAYDDWIDNHLRDWEDWMPDGLRILECFDIPTREISREEAQEALEFTLDYCEAKPWGWSPLRGVLMSGDHFASAFADRAVSQFSKLFNIPDLSFYKDPDRKHLLYPLSQVDTTDPAPHTMVVAPTGAGKTDFLLKRCKGRIFYTLPFQASINAMYERFRATIPDGDIRVLHSTSVLLESGDQDAQSLQPFPGASIKVLTPHQIASIIFGTPGFEAVMLDMEGVDIILDEVHTYSDASRSMMLEMAKALLRLNCRIHIGTATMPTALYNELLSMLSLQDEVYQVRLPDEKLDEFDRHVTHRVESEAEIEGILSLAIAGKEKVLIVCNTVGKAQELYQRLAELYPQIPSMLIHSRFRRKDRILLETRLKNEFNGNDAHPGHNPCFVVSTQVVEVSLDISFDRMITEAAPLDALVQRFGRINRKRSEATIGNYKPVHVLAPSGRGLPYDSEILKSSYEQIKDGELLRERNIQMKIDSVFPNLESKPIDTHVIFQNGKYIIKELRNKPKAILIEALEIAGGACILECDRERYEQARWDERVYLEIPVGEHAIKWIAQSFPQLEEGSYPFVIPQPEEEHQRMGLMLPKTTNFL